MRTIATLNLPSSTSGICRSAPPPCVPVPAQSAAAGDPPALADGSLDADAEGPPEVAADGVVVAPPVEQAPPMNATVNRTVSNDSRGLMRGSSSRARPDSTGTERAPSADRIAASRACDPTDVVAGHAGGVRRSCALRDEPGRAAPQGPSCTIRRDVRTDGAARGAARDQLPCAGGTFGLHRRVRPGRFAPGERGRGRRRPFHGAPDLQG